MSNKLANTAILITSITLLSKLVGFGRDVIMAAAYGTSINSDAYLMAQSIVGVITGLLMAALGTTFIPVMSDYLAHRSKDDTGKFLNVVYTITISLSAILCILGMIFTNGLVEIFAPNFSIESHDLTVQLTRLLFPVIVLTAIINLNNAKLQNHGSYLVPATIAFPMNFIMIITMILLTDSFGIQGLTISFVVGTFLQIVFQVPHTRKLGYRFKLDFDLKEEGLRKIGILIIPILIGTGIQQINTLVDRILASGLIQGSIAALTFSNRLSIFIIGLLSAAVGSVYYTSMSNYFTAGNDIQFKKLLRNMINISCLLIIPASAGLIVLRLPIIQLIFERGMFDRSASEMTAAALFFYTFGLIGFLLRDVVSRAFYAIKDTKTAMVNGSIAVGINIIVSLALVPYMGLGGLALGTSVSGIMGTILLMISLHKKIGDFGIRNIIFTLIKIVIASVVMAFTVQICYALVFDILESNLIAVVISVGSGVVVYSAVVLLLRIEEIRLFQKILYTRLGLSKHNSR